MKKGFVLMEAIVVITVLCVVLVTLYASFSKILTDVNKKSLYDNTEYIYKTNLVRNYLEKVLDEDTYSGNPYYVYCTNSLGSPCYQAGRDDYENDFFEYLGVEAVYITFWNVSNINTTDLSVFEPTTQNYIKMMDTPEENAFRIIVMFNSENNDTDKSVYEYATLRFGSRG